MSTVFIPANLDEAGISREVYLGVQQVLTEAFGVTDDKCLPEVSLVFGFYIDSIDWLNLMFQLENHFNIEINSFEEVIPTDILTNEKYLERDRLRAEYLLNVAGLKRLQRRLPWMNLVEFAKDPTRDSFSGLITVGDLCHFIEHKLANVQAQSW